MTLDDIQADAQQLCAFLDNAIQLTKQKQEIDLQGFDSLIEDFCRLCAELPEEEHTQGRVILRNVIDRIAILSGEMQQNQVLSTESGTDLSKRKQAMNAYEKIR